ncbi:hypothetical protein AALC16_03115 [Lachnospiraceae bacterium 29-91]|nr:hypothetical protein C808_04284 [Lachnospiraceae bacterium M18-1]
MDICGIQTKKTCWLVDEEAAITVRRIFSLVCRGKLYLLWTYARAGKRGGTAPYQEQEF